MTSSMVVYFSFWNKISIFHHILSIFNKLFSFSGNYRYFLILITCKGELMHENGWLLHIVTAFHFQECKLLKITGSYITDS